MSKYIDLVKNIGLFAISNIAIKFIVFFLTPLYTYYLTTSQFGLTDMLNTVVSLILPLATLSIPDAVLRFCIDDKENSRRYITIGLVVTLLGSLFVCAFLPSLNLGIFGGLSAYRWWFFSAYIMVALQTLGSNIARGLNQVKLMSVASVLSAVVNGVLSVVLIAVFHYGIEGFFVAYILGNAIGALCYFIGGEHYRYILWNDFSPSFLRVMLTYCVPLIPNALFWWVNQSINRFFITGIMGIAASGLFAAASKIPSILNLVSGVFQQAWSLSAFQEYRNEGKDKFFNNIYELYNMGMAVCTVVLIVLSRWIASFMFQKDFYAAWVYVPVLLLTFYYNSLNSFYGSIFTASMKTRALFSTTMVGGLACVVLTYPLIRILGLQGAGVAAALSTFIVLVLRVRASRMYMRIRHDVMDLVITHSLVVVSCLCMVVDTRPTFIVAVCAAVILVAEKGWRTMRILLHRQVNDA